ncbi:MAG: alpha/beta hydrolase [Methanomicrobiales archaeon]|nr:alpha/beta hydrolase [Methanomicrobiales archaeon]
MAGITAQKIFFPNGPNSVAGNLYMPEKIDPGKKYPALVFSHPGSAVKEQAIGLYAQKLAAEGFITLAFDASFQG